MWSKKIGYTWIRIIVGEGSADLIDALRENDFRITSVNGEGIYGPVKVIFTIAKRKRWAELSDIVNKNAPNAFYSVEDVKHVSQIDEVPYTLKDDLMTRMLKLKKSIW